MADVVTIREAVARAKAEGLAVSEYALRRWIRSGEIPVRKAGSKQLVFFPKLAAYLRCEESPAPAAAVAQADPWRIR